MNAVAMNTDGYVVSDDPALLDHDRIYAFLRESYWAKARAPHTQRLANQNSLCFGLYKGREQVGFARVVSDYATFAYLADVHVIEDHRGRGLSHAMVEHFLAHPRLQGLRRWALFTLDAQSLYESHGWSRYPYPERMMTRDDPDVYR